MKCKCGNIVLRGKDVCLVCFAKQDADIQRAKPKHNEDDIQEAFFYTARIVFPKLGKLLFAVPNGGKRDKREAGRMKKQGVVPGISDIICLIPNKEYKFLCMETKTEINNQSDHQIQFQREVETVGGLYTVFRSAAEGIELLTKYLKTTNYK